ncbi:MAG: XdhC family protein [Bacteroidota bacterium]
MKKRLLKEIRKIIAFYDSTDHQNERLALASVVNVEASSYRRIGARMLVSSSGQWVGGISGGCLEGDALKRSQKAIFNNTPSSVVYDTMDDDANEIGVGLGCNGRIEVLFTPIDPQNPENPIEQLRTIAVSKNPSLLLKVVESSAPEGFLGNSKLLKEGKGEIEFCSIDSKELENAAQEVKAKKRPILKTFINSENHTLKVLVEFIRPETKLIIVGDNYDVAALVGIADELGWECYIVGRKKKLSKKLFSIAKAVYEYEAFSQIKIDAYTAIVLMTHDYNWDKKILPQVIHKSVPYIGMLGPKKRMLKMQNELGIDSLDRIAHFHSPVGLDIGAESPEEIALAIASEIVAAFRNRNGNSLKFREGTIHGQL